MRSEFGNFAQRFIQDSGVRANYISQAEQYSSEILNKVKCGTLSPQAAANEANSMRNGLLDAARLKNSDIGRAVEAEKASDLTMSNSANGTRQNYLTGNSSSWRRRSETPFSWNRSCCRTP